MKSFNSLQTGKHIQTFCTVFLIRVHLFQFPSNGKAHPNCNDRRKPGDGNKVSIPFKRESTSKPEGYEDGRVE